MRRLLVILALAVVFGAAVYAPIASAQYSEKQPAAAAQPSAATKPEQQPAAAAHAGSAQPLNNIIRVAKDGTRTALCCCGAEFNVSDKTPVLQRDGISFSMCSEGCRDANANATPEQQGRTLATWREKYSAVKLASNVTEKDGVKTAVCGCGKTFTVSKDSPVIKENGVKLVCCSDACHKSLLAMSPEARLAKEMKFATGAAEPAKAKM